MEQARCDTDISVQLPTNTHYLGSRGSITSLGVGEVESKVYSLHITILHPFTCPYNFSTRELMSEPQVDEVLHRAGQRKDRLAGVGFYF